MALCAVVERTEALTESWVKKDVKQLGVVFVFFLISFVSLMQVVGRVEGVLLLCNAIVNGRTPSCCASSGECNKWLMWNRYVLDTEKN